MRRTMAIFIITLIFFVQGCGVERALDKAQVEGVWKASDGKKIIFYQDGTFDFMGNQGDYAVLDDHRLKVTISGKGDAFGRYEFVGSNLRIKDKFFDLDVVTDYTKEVKEKK